MFLHNTYYRYISFQAKANNEFMCNEVKRIKKELQEAKESAWEVPEGWFDNIRMKLQQ